MKKNMVKAWDVPTRLFHWLLVVLIACSYLSYKFGDVMMQWHMLNGYAILTLVIYRLLWGVIGSSTARFRDFIKGPGAVFSYLKALFSKEPQKFLGHNPAGGLMVVALLLLILGQGTMGLFSSDDIMVEGPLVHKVSSSWVSTASSFHRIGFWVIVGFVSLHVFAAFFYLLVKKENLIRPMVTGLKERKFVPENVSLREVSPLIALMLLAVVAALLWFGVFG